MSFDQQEEAITELIREVVADHARMTDQPLKLAIYFQSERFPLDECLFEVAENFAFNEPDPDRRIMQIAFGTSPEFQMPPGRYLRLWLTNPPEFEEACRESWQDISEIRRVVLSGKYSTLFEADELQLNKFIAQLTDVGVAA